MWTMLLPCGKLIGLLLFCFLLFLLSILFLKSNVHKTFSRTELGCPVMGTIFLVIYMCVCVLVRMSLLSFDHKGLRRWSVNLNLLPEGMLQVIFHLF